MNGEPPTPDTPGTQNDTNDLAEAVSETDEFQEFQDTKDRLQGVLEEFKRDQRHKDAATLQMCPPEQAAFADDMVGTLLKSPLHDVYLVTGYYPSARHGSAENMENGDYRAEVVLEMRILRASEDSHREAGGRKGTFVEAFNGSAHTYKFVNNCGIDMDNHPDYYLLEAGPWNMTDEVEQVQKFWKRGNYDHLITGRMPARPDA